MTGNCCSGHGQERKHHAHHDRAENRYSALTRGNKAPERNKPCPYSIEFEAVRTVTEQVTHGSPITDDRPEIELLPLHLRRLCGPHSETDGDHEKRSEPARNKSPSPSELVRHHLTDQK